VNDLADIVAPPPPSWWPQTAGWLVVGICALCALLWLGWRMWRHWRANRYRRAAIKELGRLQARLDANGPDRAQALLALAERGGMAATAPTTTPTTTPTTEIR